MVFHGKSDSDRLISEVYRRPALWDQRHPSYHNRHLTDRIWQEIATIMKHPKQVLKVKWKGLRDTFRGEMRKQEFYEKTKMPRPVWTHYKSLQFLTEQMLPKPPSWQRKSRGRRKNAKSTGDALSSRVGSSTDGQENGEARAELQQLHFEACDVLEVVDFLTAGLINEKVGDPIRMDPTTTQTPSPNSRREDKSPSPRSPDDRHPRDRRRQLEAEEEEEQQQQQQQQQQKQQQQQQQKQQRLEQQEQQAADEMKEETVNDDEVVELNSVEEYIEENEPPIMRRSATPERVLVPMIGRPSPERVIVEETSEACEPVSLAVDPLDSANRFDDNYYFFMSLLPHIRKLPADRRMLLRMQMQNLVYQEVYRKNPGSSQNGDPISVEERVDTSTSSAVLAGSNGRRHGVAWSLRETLGVDRRS